MKAAVLVMFTLVLGQCEDDAVKKITLETEFKIGAARLIPKDKFVYYLRYDGSGLALIDFRMSSADAGRLGAFTAEHIGEVMEMRVCGELLISPVIYNAIYGRNGTLTSDDVLLIIQSYFATGCPDSE